jgi:3-deoxy-D-manno-octulosonate 8-phosphate phosphatase (KDO 8-P phosphatase)
MKKGIIDGGFEGCLTMEIKNKELKKIKAIFMDVDGVLTDGKIYYGDILEEMVDLRVKSFHVRDGMAINVAQRAGLKIGFITGRSSFAAEKRAEELKIDYLFQNAKNKLGVIRDICKNEILQLDEICYIGDDLIDIPAMCAVGFAATVNDAPVEVRQHAHFISEKNGGTGAIWEIIRFILLSQGRWYSTIDEMYPIETMKEI